MGMSRSMATAYVEMTVNAGKGLWNVAEPRTPATTTRTRFADWARAAFGTVM